MPYRTSSLLRPCRCQSIQHSSPKPTNLPSLKQFLSPVLLLGRCPVLAQHPTASLATAQPADQTLNHTMNGKRAVFRIAIASALFCFLILINRELTRAALVLGPLATGLIALWNNDKPWARRWIQGSFHGMHTYSSAARDYRNV